MGRLAGALPGFFFLLCNIFNKTFLREVQRWWPVCLVFLSYPRSCVASFVDAFPLKGSRKEVFQPHLPVRLPCYDLAPITGFTLGRPLRSRTSGAPGFHGLTGGVYKARERIHRAMADARLLANPASWGRVADPSPNWGALSRLGAACAEPSLCMPHCNTCVAPDVRAVLI